MQDKNIIQEKLLESDDCDLPVINKLSKTILKHSPKASTSKAETSTITEKIRPKIIENMPVRVDLNRFHFPSIPKKYNNSLMIQERSKEIFRTSKSTVSNIYI